MVFTTRPITRSLPVASSPNSCLRYLSLHPSEQKCTASGCTELARSQAGKMVTSRRDAVTPTDSAAMPSIQVSRGSFSRPQLSQENSIIANATLSSYLMNRDRAGVVFILPLGGETRTLLRYPSRQTESASGLPVAARVLGSREYPPLAWRASGFPRLPLAAG
jgi:hypothetical protein